MSALNPVTAAEVDTVQFTSVNVYFGRPGYLETEVDAFLDRVGDTIADLTRENDRLAHLLEQQRRVMTS